MKENNNEAGEFIPPKKEKLKMLTKRLSFGEADERVRKKVIKMNLLHKQIDWSKQSPIVNEYLRLQRTLLIEAYPKLIFESRKTKQNGGYKRAGTKNQNTKVLEALIKEHINDTKYLKANKVSEIIRECLKSVKFKDKYTDQQLRRAINAIKK